MRIRLVAVLIAVAVVACGGGGSHNAAPSTTTAPPAPHPPFAVGVRTMSLVDPDRPTPPNGDYPGAPSRTLDTLVMYPAQGAPGGDPQNNAAPVTGTFPLLVYAHGLAGHPDSPFVQALAAAGYVVAAPSFPLSRFDAPGGATGADVINEPADVRFVIDKLLDQPSVDRTRVGVLGASLGATISLAVADDAKYADPRVQAAVVVAGGCAGCTGGARAPGDTYFTGRAVPLLIVHGTDDPFAPYEQSVTLFHDAPAPKFLTTLTGAKHIAYDEPWETVAVHAMTDFFDRYLKGDAAALTRLADDANANGTASLQAEPGA